MQPSRRYNYSLPVLVALQASLLASESPLASASTLCGTAWCTKSNSASDSETAFPGSGSLAVKAVAHASEKEPSSFLSLGPGGCPGSDRGSFGVVHRAVHRKSGVQVAVKLIDRSKVQHTSIERELNVLEHLGESPHVVAYHGCYVTTTQVAFVMELYVLFTMFSSSVPGGDNKSAAWALQVFSWSDPRRLEAFKFLSTMSLVCNSPTDMQNAGRGDVRQSS